MALEKYKKKRNFSKTPEPAGQVFETRADPQVSGAAPGPGEDGAPRPASFAKFSFVIQKHAASRLHYDFRLELDGVLLSWAVPKGPSLDPAEKRLAAHVEDHPIEYQDFEGIIPEGEYGGGTVVVWDRGTWIPKDNPQEAYKRGRMSFQLEGQKLKGGFSLFRITRGKGKEDNWLLVKKNDEFARATKDGDIVVERPESVMTGRTVEEVAQNKDRTWRSNRGREEAQAAAKEIAIPEDAKEAPMPGVDELSPELATLVEEAPEGANWVYEIKLDGYRTLAFIKGGEVHLISRTGKDWTQPLEPIAEACADLGAQTAIVDGEVVAFAENGTTSFQNLQNSFGEGKVDQLAYYLFDLIYLDGRDLRELPLLERKKLLSELMSGLPKKHKLRYSEHFKGNGHKIFTSACKLGVEGIIAKRADSAYLSKRTKDWVKVKCTKRQELIIGGYTDPEGSRSGIGALLVGVRDEKTDELVYAGKVGTGFTKKSLEEMAEKLSALEIEESCFDRGGPTKRTKGIHFVEPKLIAEIAFAEWTQEGILRHPSFQGLRTDKSAAEVVREAPAPAEVALPAEVKLTNPDRVLYENPSITKKQIAEYYAAIADYMLPHVSERPLMIVRCPEGMKKACFHQKHAMPGMHKAIKLVEIEESDEVKQTLYVDDVAGLVALAQMSALEIHTWGARIDKVEKPDLLVFDLDPDENLELDRLKDAAIAVRNILLELNLKSFVKTTGGKGLHIVAPISRTLSWDKAKAMTAFIADEMVRRDPNKYLATMTKAKRAGKIFVDYFRNGRGATFVAPYSTRARPGATVAMPISWDELPELKATNMYTIANAPERMRALGKDPWAELLTVKQAVKFGGGTRAA